MTKSKQQQAERAAKRRQADQADRARWAKEARVAAAGRRVEVVTVGDDEETTRFEVRVSQVAGEPWAKVAAATFRLAAAVVEAAGELPYGWPVYVGPADGSVISIELMGAGDVEVSGCRAAIERAIGSKGTPNPSMPNASTLYTVKA